MLVYSYWLVKGSVVYQANHGLLEEKDIVAVVNKIRLAHLCLRGLVMGMGYHPEKEAGLADMDIIVPSAETSLMDMERCPGVLLNSIKTNIESSIHQ